MRYHDTSTVQMWIDRDGTSRTLTRYDSLTWLTPADRATFQAHRRRLLSALPDGAVGRETDTEYPSGDPSASADGRGLPSTPGPLLRVLEGQFRAQLRQIPASQRRAWQQENHSGYLFDALEGILAGSISPAQRAAAFTDAKYVSGVRVLGAQRDAIGRPGVAIELPGPDHTIQEMVIDPSNGALLEAESVRALRVVEWRWTVRAFGRSTCSALSSTRCRRFRTVVTLPFTTGRSIDEAPV